MSTFSFNPLLQDQEDSELEIFKLLVSIVFFWAGPSGWIIISFFELNPPAFFLDRFPFQA